MLDDGSTTPTLGTTQHLNIGNHDIFRVVVGKAQKRTFASGSPPRSSAPTRRDPQAGQPINDRSMDVVIETNRIAC